MRLQQFYYGNLGTPNSNEHRPIAASADWNAIVSRLQLDIKQYELVIRVGDQNRRWADAWYSVVREPEPYTATGIFDLGQSGTLVVRLMRHYMHGRYPYLYHYLYLSPKDRIEIGGNWTALFEKLDEYNYWYAHDEDNLEAVSRLYNNVIDRHPETPIIEPFVFNLSSPQNDDALVNLFNLYEKSPKRLEPLARILMSGGTIAFEDEALEDRLPLVIAVTALLPSAMRGMISFANNAPLYNNGKLQIMFPESNQSVMDNMFQGVWRVNRQSNTIIPTRFPKPVPLVDTIMTEFQKGEKGLYQFQERWKLRTQALTQNFEFRDTCKKLETWIDITREYHNKHISHVSREKRIELLSQLKQDNSLTIDETIHWLITYLDDLLPQIQKKPFFTSDTPDEFWLWFSLVLQENAFEDIKKYLLERLDDYADGVRLWFLNLYQHVSSSQYAKYWNSSWTALIEETLLTLIHENTNYQQRIRYYRLFHQVSVPPINHEIWHMIIRSFVAKVAQQESSNELDMLLKLALHRWYLDITAYDELRSLLFDTQPVILPIQLKNLLFSTSGLDKHQFKNGNNYHSIIHQIDINGIDSIKLGYLMHRSGYTDRLADEHTVKKLVRAASDNQLPEAIQKMAVDILSELPRFTSSLKTSVKVYLADWHLGSEQYVIQLIDSIFEEKQVQEFVQSYRNFGSTHNVDRLFEIVRDNHSEWAWWFAFELMRSYPHPQRSELQSAWVYTIWKLCNVNTPPTDYDRAFFQESRLYFEMLTEAQDNLRAYSHLIGHYLQVVLSTSHPQPYQISHLHKLSEMIPDERSDIYRRQLAAAVLPIEKNALHELLHVVRANRKLHSTAQVLDAVICLQDVFPNGVDSFRHQIETLFPTINIIYHLPDELRPSQQIQDVVIWHLARYKNKQNLRPIQDLFFDAKKALYQIEKANTDFIRYETTLSERLTPDVIQSVFDKLAGTPDRFVVYMLNKQPAKTVTGLWLRVAGYTLDQLVHSELGQDHKIWEDLDYVRQKQRTNPASLSWEQLFFTPFGFAGICSGIIDLFVPQGKLNNNDLNLVQDILSLLCLSEKPRNDAEKELEFVAILLEFVTMAQALADEFDGGKAELNKDELSELRKTFRTRKSQERLVENCLIGIWYGERIPKTRLGKWLMLTGYYDRAVSLTDHDS